MKTLSVAAAIVLITSLNLSAQTAAQTNDEARTLREDAFRAAKQQAQHGRRIAPSFASNCPTQALTLPKTVTGALTSSSCVDPVLDVYENVYAIQGVAGQTLQVDYSSTNFEVFLWLETNGSGFAIPDDVSSLSSSNHTSRTTLEFTFPETQTYYIEAEALYGPGGSNPSTGTYTLVAGLKGASATCTASSTQLCLGGGRFAVTVAWKDFDNHTGVGHTIPLTGDTGSFWFFGETNYELMVKVLDARTLNNRFWVFYGALSTVEYTITVKDTVTNKTKTYFNKSGTLGSVADTDAFTP